MKIYDIKNPGGSDTYVQYNNGGVFGGSAHLILNDGTGVTTATGLTVTGNSVLGLNSAVFQPTADSATFFQILDADGNAEFIIDTTNDALLFGYTKLGTVEGSYNFILGTAYNAMTGYTYCVAVGDDIATAVTGAASNNNLIGDNLAESAVTQIQYNNIVGNTIANSTTGIVYYNNLVGYNLASNCSGTIGRNNIVGSSLAYDAATAVEYNNIVGHALASKSVGNIRYNNIIGNELAKTTTESILYNNLVGYNNATAALGSVARNNMVGTSLASAATGNITYNNIVGSTLASAATGNVTGNYMVGVNLADSFTGNILYSFVSGYRCLYNTSNEVNCEKVIAFPYESLSGSTATDLDNAIAIGFRAGLNNAYNNPALFGTQATADADKQIVLGSSYYTGGVRLYGADVEHVSATPYITLHNSTHEDTDGGRESRLNFKGEQGVDPFEETTLARIEVSHDGAGADDKGKIVISTNDGADGDTPTVALTIDSEQAVTTVKNKITPIGGIAVLLTNTTGAVTVAGQVVKPDLSTDDAVILTAADDLEIIGVFLDSGVADDAEAWVVISGIADVAMEDNTAATHGNWVRSSITEAGYSDATNTDAPQPINQTHFAEVGHCIESVAAGGEGTHILARCVLHFN